MRSSTFQVRIHFDERIRGEQRTFHFDSIQQATSHARACDAAVAYFKELEVLSSVGWPRHVRGVDVEEVVEVVPGAASDGEAVVDRAHPSGSGEAARADC